MTAKEMNMLTKKSLNSKIGFLHKMDLITAAKLNIHTAAKNGKYHTELYSPSLKDIVFVCEYLKDRGFKIEHRTENLFYVHWSDV
jgi:hypothetical protein